MHGRGIDQLACSRSAVSRAEDAGREPGNQQNRDPGSRSRSGSQQSTVAPAKDQKQSDQSNEEAGQSQRNNGTRQRCKLSRQEGNAGSQKRDRPEQSRSGAARRGWLLCVV